MKKRVMAPLAGAFILGLSALPVQGFLDPQLAQECQILVAKLEQRADKKLAKAKTGCEEALRLHEAGKHIASIVTLGKAITLAGKAVSEPGSSGSSGGGM